MFSLTSRSRILLGAVGVFLMAYATMAVSDEVAADKHGLPAIESYLIKTDGSKELVKEFKTRFENFKLPGSPGVYLKDVCEAPKPYDGSGKNQDYHCKPDPRVPLAFSQIYSTTTAEIKAAQLLGIEISVMAALTVKKCKKDGQTPCDTKSKYCDRLRASFFYHTGQAVCSEHVCQ